MDTSGFYKVDLSGVVIYGPNFVCGPFDHYKLLKDEKDTYMYPIDGWYWFDTEQKAYEFFQIEWYPEVYTMGILKTSLNETNNTENNA
jgi:hypothetical protein